MSEYCDCCSTERRWVLDHLNFDPHGAGVIPERWGDKRWTTWAGECIRHWAGQGDPLPADLDAETLGYMMKEAYCPED